MKLWISQLAANARWSKLFFVLEGTIVSYISAARKVDRAAADAFIPYAAGFAFATILNAEIARLNPPEG
jgi:tryptophan-rich sensory protein